MPNFIESAIPADTVLLGKRLKPLTLGHLLLLERFDALPVEDPDSLVFAVLVCSHDYDELLPLIGGRFTGLAIRVWRWRQGEIDWPEKFKLWQEYIDLILDLCLLLLY